MGAVNKLGKVDELSYRPPAGFHDQQNPNNGGNDYTYDANGNMNMDYNKWISNISYNHLNLPVLISYFSWKPGTIEYLYDAAGNKLQKTVTDMGVSPNKITITKYAGAFVYTNSYVAGQAVPAETLEFIGHEEGRIRPAAINTAQPLTAANTKYIYDYFMKDHLGNTRMVLTTEQQTDVYAATQEPANASKENQLFANISSTSLTKPGGFDAVAANTKVSKINGGTATNRVGPSIVLKVMPGDVISISTQAWYTGATQAVTNGLAPIKDQLLTLLSAGIVATNGTHGGNIPVADINSAAGDVLTDFLSGQPYDGSRPKAFLNWIIVDEEFKKVTSSFHMGAVQVPQITGAMQKQQLTGPVNMTVRRGGWLYVYVSNESNQDVYFDDLVVNHKRGPVVETNSYYAFGMEIPGLAAKAIGFAGNPGNRIKYNGKELQSKEFTDGSGLEWEDYGARMYDAQIGRWIAIDPLTDNNRRWSPYTYAYNNPIRYIDPDGMNAEESKRSLPQMHLADWILALPPGSNVTLGGSTKRNNSEEDQQQKSGAWDITNQWDDKMIEKYQAFAGMRAGELQKNGDKYSCEDLPLSVLIDFASQNGLPVVIQNGSGTYSAASGQFHNVESYKNEVLGTTAAKDLARPNNSIDIKREQLTGGDLILHSLETGGAIHHTQMVKSSTERATVIYQGNQDNSLVPSKYPNSMRYNGVQVQTGYYSKSSGNYINVTLNRTVPALLNSSTLSFYRWNFINWNNK